MCDDAKSESVESKAHFETEEVLDRSHQERKPNQDERHSESKQTDVNQPRVDGKDPKEQSGDRVSGVKRTR